MGSTSGGRTAVRPYLELRHFAKPNVINRRFTGVGFRSSTQPTTGGRTAVRPYSEPQLSFVRFRPSLHHKS